MKCALKVNEKCTNVTAKRETTEKYYLGCHCEELGCRRRPSDEAISLHQRKREIASPAFGGLAMTNPWSP